MEKIVSVFDIDGWKQVREIRKQFLKNNKGFIWVYDINDEGKYEESANGLNNLLLDIDEANVDKNKYIPILIYANHSDLNNENEDTNKFFDFVRENIKDRPYLIQKRNPDDSESIQEGLNWLYNNIK